jgi:hypothetical protein
MKYIYHMAPVLGSMSIKYELGMKWEKPLEISLRYRYYSVADRNTKQILLSCKENENNPKFPYYSHAVSCTLVWTYIQWTGGLDTSSSANQFLDFIFLIKTQNFLCISTFERITCDARLHLLNYFNTPNLFGTEADKFICFHLSSSLSRYVFVVIRFLMSYIRPVLMGFVKINFFALYVELFIKG